MRQGVPRLCKPIFPYSAVVGAGSTTLHPSILSARQKRPLSSDLERAWASPDLDSNASGEIRVSVPCFHRFPVPGGLPESQLSGMGVRDTSVPIPGREFLRVSNGQLKAS